MGIYQALLWYEEVADANFDFLPHIIDADKLRLSRSKAKRESDKPMPWQGRAKQFESYLSENLRCSSSEVKHKVDRLMRSESYSRQQRQNPLGTAFSALIAHVLRSYGNPKLTYEVEVRGDTVFPSIAMPGRSTSPSIDILALSDSKPVAVISSKWSLRHDRINDITNECPIYKSAAMRSRVRLRFLVVTNEFDPARLNKILIDDCVDGLVHVHKKAVTEVCRLDGRLDEMLDLTDLVNSTNSWL